MYSRKLVAAHALARMFEFDPEFAEIPDVFAGSAEEATVPDLISDEVLEAWGYVPLRPEDPVIGVDETPRPTKGTYFAEPDDVTYPSVNLVTPQSARLEIRKLLAHVECMRQNIDGFIEQGGSFNLLMASEYAKIIARCHARIDALNFRLGELGEFVPPLAPRTTRVAARIARQKMSNMA